MKLVSTPRIQAPAARVMSRCMRYRGTSIGHGAVYVGLKLQPSTAAGFISTVELHRVLSPMLRGHQLDASHSLYHDHRHSSLS